jgi:hypothetical protein
LIHVSSSTIILAKLIKLVLPKIIKLFFLIGNLDVFKQTRLLNNSDADIKQVIISWWWFDGLIFIKLFKSILISFLKDPKKLISFLLKIGPS